jgi:hypothetical protein
VRLELTRFYSLEPKSSAATNYATSPNLYHIETHSPTCALSGLNRRPAHAYVLQYGELIVGRPRTCKWGLFPLAPIRGLCLPIPSPRVPEVNYSPVWMLPAVSIYHIETHSTKSHSTTVHKGRMCFYMVGAENYDISTYWLKASCSSSELYPRMIRTELILRANSGSYGFPRDTSSC